MHTFSLTLRELFPLVTVGTPFLVLSSQRRRWRLGELCTGSSTSCTPLTPAGNTWRTCHCCPNTVNFGRTTSLSWKMSHASSRVGFNFLKNTCFFCFTYKIYIHFLYLYIFIYIFFSFVHIFVSNILSSQNALDLPSGPWPVICPLVTSLLVWPSVFSTVPSMCGTAPTPYTPQSRE